MKPMEGALFLVATTLLLSPFALRAAELVTSSPSGQASISAGGNSFGPVFSADARRVVFLSHAGNVVTNETRRESLQVFLRDLVTSNTVLVSVSTNGRGGIGNSSSPVISSNGQFVVFASEAGNLVDNDTNGWNDVFVRDLATDVTTLVSVDANGRSPFDGESGNPLVSSDGRYVYFESRGSILDARVDTSTYLFRRDLQSNTTVRVTTDDFTTSTLWSITPEGLRVAYTSATNPPGFPVSIRNELYVRDLRSNVTFWASSSLTNYPLGYRCTRAALSENGRFVAFIVVGDRPALYLRDLESASPLLVADNVYEHSIPQISANGRYVVFSDGTNVFRFDANSGTNELVNVTTLGAPPLAGIARNPVATPDGNGIVFISNSPDLVTNSSTRFQIYARDMAAVTTRLVSVATSGQPSETNSEVSLLAVTPDFSRVAFDSTAADLIDGDGNRASDVFVRDLAIATTSLISRRETSQLRLSGIAHAFIGGQCVSADGRFIAFTSYDNDLLVNDSNSRPDIFVRDMLTGDVGTAGFETNAARSPAISANGRYVVYLRRNPVFAFETSGGAVWRFDRETRTNELVSSSSQHDPAISPDGNLVAFVTANNVVVRNMAEQTDSVIAPAAPVVNRKPVFTPDGRFLLFNGSSGLFAWDTVLQQTQALSGSFVQQLAISGNARFVAVLDGSSLSTADLIVRTNQVLRSGVLRLAATLNNDGTLVVFSDDGRRLLALDRTTGQESVVAPSGEPIISPAVSADGRYVVYARRTLGVNGSEDNALTWQLFVRDRMLGTTTLITTGADGVNANGPVSQPVLAADGRTVVFHSVASDLVSGDYNDKSDVFVLKLGSADTDGDGMDDDWEVAYFGNLSRNGSGDFDGDGATDLQEFLAGTDPTNGGSVFRVLTVTPIGGGSTQVIWSGNATRSYRVEYKDDLNVTNWTTVNSAVSWIGSTASATDATASAKRFYRVVRLP